MLSIYLEDPLIFYVTQTIYSKSAFLVENLSRNIIKGNFKDIEVMKDYATVKYGVRSSNYCILP
jgi:hypothetical protein